MEKMYCFTCNKNVLPTTKKVVNTYSYRNKTFTIEEYIYYCPKCQQELIDEVIDSNLEKIYNGYLNLFDLDLQSFLKIRKSLNLTQEEFAISLGWSKRTIIRYEKGEEIPSGEYLNVYKKLNENKDFIFEYLKLNRKSIDNDVYYNIVKKLNLNIDIKSRNAIIYILKDKPLFLMPLLKMLFAIDFLSFKELKKPITQFHYAKLPMGPVVDNYVQVINEMLRRGDIRIYDTLIIDNDCKNKYEVLHNCDLNLFSDAEIKIMNTVKEQLSGKTTKELSDWSHLFKGWIETSKGHIIDFKKYSKYFEL